jgi:hypothetical protein
MLFFTRLLTQATFPLAFGGDHLDDLAPASDQIGEQPCHRVGICRSCGLVASAKCAITMASIGSVLARLPSALGEGTHLRRIDHHHRQPAPARPAATTVSKPPVASIATSFGDRL